MAHDKQYKEDGLLGRIAVGKFDCPKRGEKYWNRYTHRVEEADRDLQERFLIVRGENNEIMPRP